MLDFRTNIYDMCSVLGLPGQKGASGLPGMLKCFEKEHVWNEHFIRDIGAPGLAGLPGLPGPQGMNGLPGQKGKLSYTAMNE